MEHLDVVALEGDHAADFVYRRQHSSVVAVVFRCLLMIFTTFLSFNGRILLNVPPGGFLKGPHVSPYPAHSGDGYRLLLVLPLDLLQVVQYVGVVLVEEAVPAVAPEAAVVATDDLVIAVEREEAASGALDEVRQSWSLLWDRSNQGGVGADGAGEEGLREEAFHPGPAGFEVSGKKYEGFRNNKDLRKQNRTLTEYAPRR